MPEESKRKHTINYNSSIDDPASVSPLSLFKLVGNFFARNQRTNFLALTSDKNGSAFTFNLRYNAERRCPVDRYRYHRSEMHSNVFNDRGKLKSKSTEYIRIEIYDNGTDAIRLM